MRKIYLTLISIIILSCSNDDSNENLESTILLIKQVNENGIVSRKYTYQDNLISSREYYDSGELWRKEYFEYFNDTIFFRSYNSSNQLSETRKYYSINNNTSRRDRYDSNDNLINYRIYNFSNNNCGFVNMDIYDSNDVLISKSTFDYIDSNCSMETTQYNSSNEIISKEEWIRDNKNLFNKNILLDFLRTYNLGNTTNYSRWDSNNNINQEYSYSSTFQYNNLNYPIYENREYSNGSSKEITYEYY